MSDRFALRGKRILVTGGTRGIGRAVALELARAGASVVAVWVRARKAAESLEAEAKDAGLDIALCRGDLAAEKGMEAVLAAVEEGGGVLDGLVYCAATGVHKGLDELTLRHLDWTFALNVRAYFELVRRLVPSFRHGASIVAISSHGATRSVPAYSLVGASKGALESMSRHMATELAPRGIRVNVLVPGTVVTDAWEAMPDREARLEEAAARTPRGRLTTPEEVAWVARFLCSDAAAAVVGHTLVVDGGAGLPI